MVMSTLVGDASHTTAAGSRANGEAELSTVVAFDGAGPSTVGGLACGTRASAVIRSARASHAARASAARSSAGEGLNVACSRTRCSACASSRSPKVREDPGRSGCVRARAASKCCKLLCCIRQDKHPRLSSQDRDPSAELQCSAPLRRQQGAAGGQS